MTSPKSDARQAAAPGRRRVRRTYPDRPEVARARLIARLRAVVGERLDDPTAEAVLRTARAFEHVAMRELDEYLARAPDALTGLAADAPWVLARLAHALTDAGYAVPLPVCVHCQQPKVDLRRMTAQGRSCDWCATRQILKVCARCGQVGYPVAQRAEGTICRRCYNTDEQFVRPCSSCGKDRPPTTRTATGSVLCWACAPRPHRVCAGCGEPTRIHTNSADGPVCRACYRHPQRPCGQCGRIAVIAQRAIGSRPDLCHRCRDEPLHVCGGCGATRPATAFWPIGPVCRGCYRTARRHPAACTGCGTIRVLVARSDNGASICGPCAGVDIDFACRECRRVVVLYADSRCAQCVLTARVTTTLRGPDGTIPAALQPLADVLVGARRPDSMLRWLHRYSASMLPRLTQVAPPITHATIDRLPQPHRLGYLRQLLVHAGVLPVRVEPLERVAPWLDQLLARTPARHQVLVRPFATWAVLRAARRAAACGRYPDSRAERDRSKIRTALRLFEWAARRGITLDQLRQADLDIWLTEHPTLAAQTRCFIVWTNRRGLTTGLDVPTAGHAEASRFLDIDEHLQQLRRCLRGDDLPHHLRVTAALMLLYGVPVSRIRTLTTEHITRSGRSTFITLDRRPVLLPGSLAQLLDQLVAAPTQVAATQPHPTQPRYLLPGLPPSRPLTAGTLVRQLNQHGITARPARNTTLLTLAADLPAAVLADTVGLHPNTATRWARLANSAWASYLAAASPAETPPSSSAPPPRCR